jgi:glutathione S-transferase
MSLTIYGAAASRAFRVYWTAEELGMAYEQVAWTFGGPEIKSAAYRAINPNATIPAIVDNGFALFESLAITLYLARKAGQLWPADLRGEALAYQWTLWGATEVEATLGQWAYHTLLLPEAERKPQLAEEAARRLPVKLEVLDGTLAGRQWLAADVFTIADLNLAAILFRAPSFGLDRWPRVADWHRRCYARPAAQRAVALREVKQA